MPGCPARRRWFQSCMVSPITSCPSARSMAATVEESTPPDMATAMVLALFISNQQSAVSTQSASTGFVTAGASVLGATPEDSVPRSYLLILASAVRPAAKEIAPLMISEREVATRRNNPHQVVPALRATEQDQPSFSGLRLDFSNPLPCGVRHELYCKPATVLSVAQRFVARDPKRIQHPLLCFVCPG
jgi:hypothetical protein